MPCWAPRLARPAHARCVAPRLTHAVARARQQAGRGALTRPGGELALHNARAQVNTVARQHVVQTTGRKTRVRQHRGTLVRGWRAAVGASRERGHIRWHRPRDKYEVPALSQPYLASSSHSRNFMACYRASELRKASCGKRAAAPRRWAANVCNVCFGAAAPAAVCLCVQAPRILFTSTVLRYMASCVRRAGNGEGSQLLTWHTLHRAQVCTAASVRRRRRRLSASWLRRPRFGGLVSHCSRAPAERRPLCCAPYLCRARRRCTRSCRRASCRAGRRSNTTWSPTPCALACWSSTRRS